MSHTNLDHSVSFSNLLARTVSDPLCPQAPPDPVFVTVRPLCRNYGTVQKSDQFVYVGQKISYNEPDNVTCSECGWAVGTPWHYLHQIDPLAPPPPPPPPPPQTHNLTHVCATECCQRSGCVGFLFEAHSDINTGGCVKGGPCCWFKSHLDATAKKPPSVGATIYKIDSKGDCSTSVVCTDCDSPGQDAGGPVNPTGPAPPPTDDNNKIPPPMGIRSSPALGGVTTGSTELRADGSFREWTIFNQGPAGSGKYGLVDDVWMAARVGTAAKMLRTHPPSYASSAAVDALTFSGTYPVTRLNVTDTSFDAKMSVYGYSTLKPTDLKVRCAWQRCPLV